MGTEGGVDTKVGTDLELMVDMSGTISGAAGAKASMGSMIMTAECGSGHAIDGGGYQYRR